MFESAPNLNLSGHQKSPQLAGYAIRYSAVSCGPAPHGAVGHFKVGSEGGLPARPVQSLASSAEKIGGHLASGRVFELVAGGACHLDHGIQVRNGGRKFPVFDVVPNPFCAGFKDLQGRAGGSGQFHIGLLCQFRRGLSPALSVLNIGHDAAAVNAYFLADFCGFPAKEKL